MTLTKQHTLGKSYTFEGKGLHTGRHARMTVSPAAAGTGIIFKRKDLGEDAIVEALAENVTCTARSTTIAKGEVSIATVEHIMSAFMGLGVDNALVEIDNAEVPILDGSARLYVESISADGLAEQEAPSTRITLDREIEVRDENSGSYIRITPSDHPEITAISDFNSRVLGVQSASWDPSVDYASQIGPCRTFVFFHEIEFLARQGLVKGGDVDNAIVIVEHPVTDEQISSLCSLLDMPALKLTSGSYLDNVRLRFPDECGRHKLLDLLGDLRLAGGVMNAKVTAFKPGHGLNTAAAKAVRKALNLQRG